MSNREDALSLVCLIESAQYGLQFGDGSLRKGRALTTEEMRIIEKALYAYAVPVAAPSEQFEHLDLQNHQLRRAMQKMMARLTELLDEDKFAEVEAIAKSAGVEPPIAAQQQAEPALVQMRMRPMWREEGGGWTELGNITEAAAQDYERHPIYQDWQYEVRRLYLGAQPGQQGETGADERTAQLPQVPQDVVEAIWRYGDSRADGGHSAKEIGAVIMAIRQALAAQPGQRAGMADGFHNRLWKLVENYADDVALYNEAVRADAGVAEAGDACLDAERKLRALIETIPTQQQEGSQP
ncbi:hypothetical protein QkW1_22 [Ralstonia phage QkW1]